jgi:multisubunit Na+/H+ antiporter MnhE subunit
MLRIIFWLLVLAVIGYLLGMLLGALLTATPSSWLETQSPTGRPSRLVGLLTLLPIVVIALIVLAVRVTRRINSKKARKSVHR